MHLMENVLLLIKIFFLFQRVLNIDNEKNYHVALNKTLFPI